MSAYGLDSWHGNGAIGNNLIQLCNGIYYSKCHFKKFIQDLDHRVISKFEIFSGSSDELERLHFMSMDEGLTDGLKPKSLNHYAYSQTKIFENII